MAKAAAKADAANGKLMFAAAGCIACHRVGAASNAGIPFIGPELETIGNTLSTERIIEETLWPGRHVKEGFSLLQVTTKNGNVHQGYEQRSREGRHPPAVDTGHDHHHPARGDSRAN